MPTRVIQRTIATARDGAYVSGRRSVQKGLRGMNTDPFTAREKFLDANFPATLLRSGWRNHRMNTLCRVISPA